MRLPHLLERGLKLENSIPVALCGVAGARARLARRAAHGSRRVVRFVKAAE